VFGAAGFSTKVLPRTVFGVAGFSTKVLPRTPLRVAGKGVKSGATCIKSDTSALSLKNAVILQKSNFLKKEGI
jgi:hypothetical protein